MDVFDTIEETSKPDVFDQVAGFPSVGGGDVFDAVASEYEPLEVQQARDQQDMERRATAGEIGRPLGETVRSMMNFPGKVLGAASYTGEGYSPFVGAGLITGLTGGGWHWPTDEEVEKPLISPETIKTAGVVASGGLTAPFVYGPEPTSTAGKMASGLGSGIADAVAGFSSPSNLALLPLGTGKNAVRLLGTVFAAQAASHFPEQWKAFNETDDVKEKTKIATEVLVGLGLPLASFLPHGAKVAERGPEVDPGSLRMSETRLPPGPDAFAALNAEIERTRPTDGVVEPNRPTSEVRTQPTPDAIRAAIEGQSQPSLEESRGEPNIRPVEPSIIKGDVFDAVEKEAVSEPVDVSRQKALEDEARRAHEEYLREEAERWQEEHGDELLDAVADSGGMPSKNSPHYSAEMETLHEEVRNPERREPISYNKLFRESAPDMDELATRLRDRGFPFETADELKQAVQDRIRTGQKVYGLQEAQFSRQAVPKEAREENLRAFMAGSKVVDEQGNPLPVYHGTARGDRVGYRFQKNRATSGPMPFFTSDREIAEGYSKGKADTSLEEPSDYAGWFKYRPEGSRSEVDLDRAWYHLTPERRAEITNNLYTTGYRNAYEGEGPIVRNSQSIMDRAGVEWELRQAKGNALKAAKEIWLSSGSLFGDEARFMEVLRALGGDERFRFDDPHATNPKVYDTYLSIRNPLDTSAIPPAVMTALEKRANRQRTSSDYGSDAWDKRMRSGRDWIESLQRDQVEGTTHAWTSIPDWVTDTLKAFGYDGIKDKGGKYHDTNHTVWIPFDPRQIKSASQNRGTFDPSKADIRLKRREADYIEPGDLLSKQTEDFRLVGEKGIDHEARQREAEARARNSEEAKRVQNEQQGTLFQRNLDEHTGQTYSLDDETRRAFTPSADKSADLGLQAIAASLEKDPTNAEFGRARLVRVDPPKRSTNGTLQAVSALARRAGTQVVYFLPDKPVRINGAALGKKLYINVNSLTDPIHVLAGHETWHAIQRAEPDLARAIKRAIQLNPEAYRGYREGALRKGYGKGEVKSEFVADLVGEALADPVRLHQAIGSGLAKRVLVRLQQWVDKALQFFGLREKQGLGEASAAVANLREVRAKIVEALREPSQTKQAETGRGHGESESMLPSKHFPRERPTEGENSRTPSSTIRPKSQPEPNEPQLKRQGVTIQGIKQELAARESKERVAFGYDAANTRANERARQAANSVALDFGSAKNPSKSAMADREAMPFIVEAGGNKNELLVDLNRIANSKDQKLAKQYVPIIEHAIANFDRLDKLQANYQGLMATRVAREKRAGLKFKEVENYVTRLLEQPESKGQFVAMYGSGKSGGSRYFVKGRSFEKLSDAIHEGYAPKSTDIVELTHRRVESGERLVQQKLLQNELKTLNAPDGNPILGELEHVTPLSGKPEVRVPKGYSVIQAGGTPLVVHEQFKPLFDALYGNSKLRSTTAGRFLMRYAGVAKQGTLMLDTFHVGRVMYKELAYSKGWERAGYNKGLSILEFSDTDLNRAVSVGDITKAQADYARANRGKADLLIKHGLNVGRVADNIEADLHGIPGLRGFNSWIFQKLSRGAMLQTAIRNLERNQRRFPERGVEGNARQTAREMNEVFGNLQSQGIFKSKTFQDAARLVFLAPNWTESQFKAELRGYGQLARAPIDLARGAVKGRFRLGTVAQGQITAVLGMLAANQVINYLTTGKPTTFLNEKGHWLDAFIPDWSGKGRGFWFNPMEIAAEYSHAAMKYLAQHEHPVDVASHIASNKLSPLARGIREAVTGRDYGGRAFLDSGDRFMSAPTSILPSPMPLGGLLEKDPRQPLGYRFNRQPASMEKQLLQSVGMKVTPAQSPRSKMFNIAHDYRADKSYGDAAGEYNQLRSALDNNNREAAKAEIELLLKGGKKFEDIKAAVGIRKDGTIKRETFAGSLERDREMLRHLKPQEKAIYDRAQLDHQMNARRFQEIAAELRRQNPRLLSGTLHPTPR